MKKILVLGFIIVASCISVNAEQAWVDGINAGNGHVTYTDNLIVVTDKGIVRLAMRKDYICSQNKYAILRLNGYSNDNIDKAIDLDFLVDPKLIGKYTPAEEQDYAVRIIRPYCYPQYANLYQ